MPDTVSYAFVMRAVCKMSSRWASCSFQFVGGAIVPQSRSPSGERRIVPAYLKSLSLRALAAS